MALERRAREALRRVLAARDQDGFAKLTVGLVMGGFPAADVERFAREELHAQPEDVREWWEGPCNGLLN